MKNAAGTLPAHRRARRHLPRDRPQRALRAPNDRVSTTAGPNAIGAVH